MTSLSLLVLLPLIRLINPGADDSSWTPVAVRIAWAQCARPKKIPKPRLKQTTSSPTERENKALGHGLWKWVRMMKVYLPMKMKVQTVVTAVLFFPLKQDGPGT